MQYCFHQNCFCLLSWLTLTLLTVCSEFIQSKENIVPSNSFFNAPLTKSSLSPLYRGGSRNLKDRVPKQKTGQVTSKNQIEISKWKWFSFVIWVNWPFINFKRTLIHKALHTCTHSHKCMDQSRRDNGHNQIFLNSCSAMSGVHTHTCTPAVEINQIFLTFLFSAFSVDSNWPFPPSHY